MTWGAYFMFYQCPECGRKYRWALEDMSDPEFGQCPSCQVMGELKGETKDISQGESRFEEYEYL